MNRKIVVEEFSAISSEGASKKRAAIPGSVRQHCGSMYLVDTPSPEILLIYDLIFVGTRL